MGRRAIAYAALFGLLGLASGGCPFADMGALHARAAGLSEGPVFDAMVDDSSGYLTDDTGNQIADQESLRVGERGPTLLEDFVFRQKMTHFDHERVPERVVHARGAGAHGTFTSYGDWSNITAASFLNCAGKETPTFVRFSTVAGSRGSADTARDVHGFATRFFTDEGNFDIVGNNIPVFFIQDAIQFPDLIHAVKPSPDNEIPQAATAHDSAWDFFSQQASVLHTLFYAMSGYGIPRGYRHMDGFGVHSYRFVTDEGNSKFVKFHWKSKQGRASLVWEEAQILSGKNPDAHRQDLWEAIASGNGPEYELAIQLVDEDKALAFGFDLLDPTKIIPEEFAPLQKIGVMKLHTNPTNYFAETEQIMFQPGHIVRGVDFSEDPLLQGRLFSYLDTQLSRHSGPNFEQLPINRPHIPIHNNHRDGNGQNLIHKNVGHYTPNTLNGGNPQQANKDKGRGFFTSPSRSASGNYLRIIPSSFNDHWSQPRLFYNSLEPIEQQFLINALRFEISKVNSTTVKENVLVQLNRVSHDIAVRVATALGLTAPEPNSTYYHDNTTAGITITGVPLPSVATLKVGILSTVDNATEVDPLAQAATLGERLTADGLKPVVVAEHLVEGVDTTYSTADAVDFDAVIVTSAADAAGLFAVSPGSPLYPPMRPLQIASSAYLFGKPVAYFGEGGPSTLLAGAGFDTKAEGVYAGTSVDDVVGGVEEGLKTFKFTRRFPMDKT
ncbi:CATB protein [Xylariaceae sp. FL0662B]|nr:CATB protein [Xylariaceae sp. FL0662B]